MNTWTIPESKELSVFFFFAILSGCVTTTGSGNSVFAHTSGCQQSCPTLGHLSVFVPKPNFARTNQLENGKYRSSPTRGVYELNLCTDNCNVVLFVLRYVRLFSSSPTSTVTASN